MLILLIKHTSFILPIPNNPLSFLLVLLPAGFYLLTTPFTSYGYTVLVAAPSNMLNVDKAQYQFIRLDKI